MKKIRVILFVGIVGFLSFTLFSETTYAAGLIPCATTEHPEPCTLCHLIVGFKGLIDYGMGLITIAAIAGIFFAGVMYIISTGDEGMMTKAKGFLKSSLIGFTFVFLGWLLVNTTMWVVGTKGDLGIGVESWNKFTCSTVGSPANPNPNPNPNPASTCVTKEIQSIEIQCEAGMTDSITLSIPATTDKPDNYQLKAIGTFKCIKSDGVSQNVTEDVTADPNVKWESAGEAVAKSESGKITAVKSGVANVKATYTDNVSAAKTASAEATIYVNSCPLDDSNDQQTSMMENKNNLFSTLAGQKAYAKTCPVCKKSKAVSQCELIAGNPNADFVFVLARAKFGVPVAGFEENQCKNSKDWNDNSPSELGEFKTLASEMAGGLNLISSDSQTHFAVYRLDVLYDAGDLQEDGSRPKLQKVIQKDCPNALKNKLLSYGFVYNGSENGHSVEGNSYYCITGMNHKDRLFAHEHIGHIFAKMADEYYVQAQKSCNPDEAWINITKDKQCSKWQNIVSAPNCYAGCQCSKKSDGDQSKCFRSTENSIMRDTLMDGGIFSPLQNYIVDWCVNNYAACPPSNLIEQASK